MQREFSKTAGGIWHKPYHDWLIESDIINKLLSTYPDMQVQDQFLNYYPEWIKSSKHNSFLGFDNLPNKYVSVGVTQALDDFAFYCSRNNLTLRVFRGEYPYSRSFSNWDNDWIENKPLQNGDAVIISLPFSATGSKHESFDWLIKTCNSNNIPVFVDCAFFGACYDIDVNFLEPCIDTIAFSVTKGLSAYNFRSGICFSKRNGKDSSLDINTQYQNSIHLNLGISLALMKQFSPDTLVDCYKTKQLQICKHYNLKPSNTIQLGTGGDEWEDYSRDGVANRVNIKNFIV